MIESMNSEGRIVCRFSCGAASAVATKIVLSRFDTSRVVILNALIKEEHPDNRRFCTDCEKWFGMKITVLKDDRYGASVHAIWKKKKFIVNGIYGAPCSAILKRELLEKASLPTDKMVLGFTVEEIDRAERFRKEEAIFPLIEASLTKSDCKAIIERAGIQLPKMYALGFNNANCIGCCKGGEGYWNKIRKLFPDRFEEVAKIQDEIGPGSYFFRDRKTGVRYGLRQLPEGKGRHKTELPECSFFCDSVSRSLQSHTPYPSPTQET